MHPYVSIVVPNYNKSYLLKRCVDSLLSQTYPYLEVIVVDNNSSDDSIDLVSTISDSRLTILDYSNNGCIAKSRNYGVECSQYPIIAFCDSDDYWLPHKLETQVSDILCIQNFFISYTQIFLSREHNLNHGKSFALDPKRPFEDLFYNGNVICTSSVMLSRQLFLSVGGFSECPDFIGWEDFFLWLSILKLNPYIHFVSEPLTVYDFNGLNHTKPSAVVRITNIIISRLYSGFLIKPPWAYYALAKAHLELNHSFVACRMFCLSFVASIRYPRRFIRYLFRALCFPLLP